MHQCNAVVYVEYKADIIIECNLFSQWYSWQIAHLSINNIDSLTILYHKRAFFKSFLLFLNLHQHY